MGVLERLGIEIDDLRQTESPFQPFQKPALSSTEGFNRFAPFNTGISPFQAFQLFHRFAPFKSFKEIETRWRP